MTERKASMGDKVYRGDVVKFIRNNISLGAFMKRTVKTADEACWDLCDKLNYVPAIEEKPEPHWIPLSEGLPKEDGRYQVTRYDYVTNTEFIDILWYEENQWWNRHSTGNYAVTAWMPLPEPYKGVNT